MALAVAALGSVGASAAVNPTVITLTAGAGVGDAVVVFCRSGTITACVDSRGNTYTKIIDVVTDANSGTKAEIWLCASLTTALSTGDTITVTGTTGIEELAGAFMITGKPVTYDANVVHTDEPGASPWGPLGPFTPAQAETVLIACTLGSATSSPTITTNNLDSVGWSKIIDLKAGASGDARLSVSYSLRVNTAGAESVSGTITSPSFNKHHVMLFSLSPAAVVSSGQRWPHGKKGTSPTTGQLFPRGVIL